MSTGETIRLRRKRLLLTQIDLSKLAGVNPSSVFRVEQDRNVETATLAKIISALEQAEEGVRAPQTVEELTPTERQMLAHFRRLPQPRRAAFLALLDTEPRQEQPLPARPFQPRGPERRSYDDSPYYGPDRRTRYRRKEDRLE